MSLGERVYRCSATERIIGTDDRRPKILLGALILVILIGTALGGSLMMLAFWGAVIIGAVLLVRRATGQAREATGPTRPTDPTEMLRRRYAAGEIDQATYQRMKAELDTDGAPTTREAVGCNGGRR